MKNSKKLRLDLDVQTPVPGMMAREKGLVTLVMRPWFRIAGTINRLAENSVRTFEEISKIHDCNRRPEEIALRPKAGFHQIAEKL